MKLIPISIVIAAAMNSYVVGNPPSGHPIYLPPKLSVLVAQENVSDLPRPDPDKEIVWTMSMERRQYYIGEPIVVRLAVQNNSKSTTYRLSAPYQSHRVSTVGTWFHAPGKQPPEDIVEMLRANLGYPRDLKGNMAHGVPVYMEAGERNEGDICINVLETIHRPQLPPRYKPGVGFAKPGTYRFYIRYVNLDAIMRSPRPLKNSVAFPFRPVVMGPFEIEIMPIPGIDTTKLSVQIGEWEQDCNPTDEVNVVRIDDIRPILDSAALADAKYKNLRAALRLAILREKYIIGTGFRGQVDVKTCEQLLKECEEGLTETSVAPVKDSYLLTKCYLLVALGRKSEALELAKRSGNVDCHQWYIDEISID